jgi:hypothetical protein
VELKDANELLKPGYLPLESGYARLANGGVVVAAMHRVYGCNGAMLQWWFQHKKTLEEFVRWHPTEHVSAEYRDGMLFPTHNHGGQILKGRVQARPPSDLFDAGALAASGASVVSYARFGPADSAAWVGGTAHVGRDTEYGCEVRSRTWLGDFDPPDTAPPRQMMEVMFSEANALWQMKHSIEEFYHLSQFLPDLFERRDRSE